MSGAVSGLATGVFSIPEGMAYAQLAGVNPLYGLYSGIVATLVASLATGTVLMISTLTSAIALSTGSVLEAAGIADADTAGAVFTITLLTGGIMLVLGLLRMGMVVNFVSQGVMTGFVAAASLLIVVGEMGDFSGYDPQGANKLAEIVDWVANVGQWDTTTTAVSLVTVLLVVVGKRFALTEKLAPVLVLVGMSLAVALLDLGVESVGDIAAIPSALPTPVLPDLSMVPDLALGSVSVAIVALVQGSGISTAYPNPDGSRASTDRDFVGQGLGNVTASFFQSMPTGGSLSRTGISVDGGASSRWGGVFAAAWLAVLVLLFGDLAEGVPLAVIAGLLFVIGFELIVGRLAVARLTEHASAGSLVAMLVTFGTALFIPLQWTIFIGAGLSLALYVAASYSAGNAFRLVRGADGYWREEELPDELPSGEVVVIGFRGTWFYAEVPRLRDRLPHVGDATGSVVVLRMRGIPDMHGTGLSLLGGYLDALAAGGNVLLLEGVEPRLRDTLVRTGYDQRVGADRLFAATEGITQSLDRAWDRATALVAGPAGEQGDPGPSGRPGA